MTLAPMPAQPAAPPQPSQSLLPPLLALPQDTQPRPFDALAAAYDTSFSRSVLGRLMRDAVWRRLDVRFAPGQRILELGCGTGEDAIHLARRGVHVVATDASAAMLAEAGRKIAALGLGRDIELRQMAAEDLARPSRAATAAGPTVDTFDGVLSNFGALNCVADLRHVAAGCGAAVRQGGFAVLCVMGPLVPWEWAWFGLRGRPGKALRRLRPGGTEWRGAVIRYPTIGRLRRLLAPTFHLRRVAAVGALLPPSYVEPWAARHLRLMRRLARWERRVETWAPLPWLADHYLLELERR